MVIVADETENRFWFWLVAAWLEEGESESICEYHKRKVVVSNQHRCRWTYFRTKMDYRGLYWLSQKVHQLRLISAFALFCLCFWSKRIFCGVKLGFPIIILFAYIILLNLMGWLWNMECVAYDKLQIQVIGALNWQYLLKAFEIFFKTLNFINNLWSFLSRQC